MFLSRKILKCPLLQLMTFHEGIRANANFTIGNAHMKHNLPIWRLILPYFSQNLRRYVYNGVMCGVLMGFSDRYCLCIFFSEIVSLWSCVFRVTRYVIRTYS